MRKLLSTLAVFSLLGCTNAAQNTDGYDLEIAAYFRSDDAGWASKWKDLEGGLDNIRRSTGEVAGSYLLIHVTGVDPKRQKNSTMCVVYIAGPPKAGPCILQKTHEVFAPVEIVEVKTATDRSRGGATMTAIVGVRPTSWLNIEPKTIGSVVLELPS